MLIRMKMFGFVHHNIKCFQSFNVEFISYLKLEREIELEIIVINYISFFIFAVKLIF